MTLKPCIDSHQSSPSDVTMSEEVRCFISIDVEDPGILAKMSAVQESLARIGADLKIVDTGNVHVTLKFLGNVEEERLSELKRALSHVKFSPFTLELKGVGAFPSLSRINVIWVGIGEGEAAVQSIFEQVEDQTASLGFRREGRDFNAHITVARARSGRMKEELAQFLRNQGDESFGSFQSNRVRLKKSILKPSGPQYSTLYEVLAS